MTTVQRYDYSGISGVEKTPQGFLRIPAHLTRVGVLAYKRADGSTFRELRLPEEVFSQKSLDSLKNAPVTDLHPTDMVTSANVRSLQRGVVAEDVRQADSFVKATVIVQDSELIDRINSGVRRELSPGYTCRVDETPGTWNGEHYDGVQRDITYNHLAVGPRGWARSGPEVRLHVDSAWGENLESVLLVSGKSLADLAVHLKLDAFALQYIVDGWDQPTPEVLQGVSTFLKPTPPTPPKVKMEFVEIKLDGATYKVAKEDAPHLQRALDGAQAKLDGIVSQATAVQAKLDAATAPATLAALVSARVALETKAQKILGSEVKLDGLTEKEIRLQVIAKADPAFKSDGKSDDYLAARFDMVDCKVVATNAQVAAGVTGPAVVVPVTEVKLDAREAANKAAADAWLSPLAFSSVTK